METSPTESQIEQAQFFMHLVEEDPESLDIRPIVNSKTGRVNLGICAIRPDEADDESENVYLLAILVKEGDPLLKHVVLLDDSDVVTERPPRFGWLKRLWPFR